MITTQIALVMLGWAIAGGSPGPATLAISGHSLSDGRRAGLLVALGIVVGSASWGVAAALGMSAVMMANAWIIEIVRYAGAAYLLFLAVKSLRRALLPASAPKVMEKAAKTRLFVRGYLIHITNPKAILAWGAIYSIALPTGASTGQVWHLFGLLISVSTLVFLGYAILFSTPRIASAYRRAQRWFDLAFAALFGAASIKILTARLGD